jgi:hypothetical protein
MSHVTISHKLDAWSYVIKNMASLFERYKHYFWDALAGKLV